MGDVLTFANHLRSQSGAAGAALGVHGTLTAEERAEFSDMLERATPIDAASMAYNHRLLLAHMDCVSEAYLDLANVLLKKDEAQLLVIDKLLHLNAWMSELHRDALRLDAAMPPDLNPAA